MDELRLQKMKIRSQKIGKDNRRFKIEEVLKKFWKKVWRSFEESPKKLRRKSKATGGSPA